MVVSTSSGAWCLLIELLDYLSLHTLGLSRFISMFARSASISSKFRTSKSYSFFEDQ